jgi:hypothetical protein
MGIDFRYLTEISHDHLSRTTAEVFGDGCQRNAGHDPAASRSASQIVRREIRDTGIRDRWHKPITQLVQLTTFPVGTKRIACFFPAAKERVPPYLRPTY